MTPIMSRKNESGDKRRRDSETKPQAFAENVKHVPRVSWRCERYVAPKIQTRPPWLLGREPCLGLTRD